MKPSFEKFGFLTLGCEYSEEALANIYTLEHKKSGAMLYYLDREDNNKTFAIAFPTPPEDSTGVFHIIEHSVLCGSERFPVKEPFVDLLKGSLNTFLNAVTYPEKTVYPVSSRCDKDFLGLTEVYLDAVFHPLMLRDKRIFMQEGWHYLYDKKSDTLGIGGVVYSEMQGAYSSPDDIAQVELSRLLFKGTPYEHDSGGDPREIPELTYEDFVAKHKEFYKPSSARLFLDGSVDLEAVLPLIDRYLSEGEREERSALFAERRAMDMGKRTVFFVPPEAEEGKPRGRLLFGYCYGDATDPRTSSAVSLLSLMLFSDNESPLKKRLLETGLCREVDGWNERGYFNSLVLELRGVREEDVPLLEEAVGRAIGEVVKEGIPKETLHAFLNRLEFRIKERDHGSTPIGVTNALNVLGTVINGRPVSEAFYALESLAFLREAVKTDYFETLLSSVTVGCPHRAELIMLPDPTLEEREAARLSERLAAVRRSMSEEDIARIVREAQELEIRQTSEDTEEARATLPRLSLRDITLENDSFPFESFTLGAVPTVAVSSPIKGILYTKLYFDCTDLTNEEYSMLPTLSLLLSDLPTKRRSVRELKDLVQRELGSFAFSPASYITEDDGKRVFLTLNTSVLSSRREVLYETISEVTLETDFTALEDIKRLLSQADSALGDNMVATADSVIIDRAEAAVSGEAATKEQLIGYEAYLRTKKYYSEFLADPVGFAKRLEELAGRIFVRERLTLCIGGDTEACEGLESLAEAFPVGDAVLTVRRDPPLSLQNEGLAIPSAVAHVATAAKSEAAVDMLGTLRVVRSILSYEYLWNEVRVRGGAYGTGFYVRRNGVLGFYTYRDPSPRASIDVFSGAAEFLRRFVDEGNELTDYIIGALGEQDPLYSPRQKILHSFSCYFTGWTGERELEIRRNMLSVDGDSVRRAADVLEQALRGAKTVVAASPQMLAELSDILPSGLTL